MIRLNIQSAIFRCYSKMIFGEEAWARNFVR